MNENKMSPVLKWAGGKTQLLNCIKERMPLSYNNYFEPFLGGAAVLLNFMPQKAFVSDINRQLVNVYEQLKISPESLVEKVNALDSLPCSKELYYKLRERYNLKIANNELDTECAALMIWINKHCFNGLYRVNGSGMFNVPFNNRTNGKSIDEGNLREVSEYLRNADVAIACLDFEEACNGVMPGDFVYFDSPYIPESETAYFTDYTVNGFSESDHKRLAALFKRLDRIGARLMLSNNDVPLIYSLYEGYNIQSIDVKRMINSNAVKRTGKEVLITNY